MSLGRCHWPIWQSDDFSRCFQSDILQVLLPLVACTISFLCLTIQFVRQAALHSQRSDNGPLPADNGADCRSSPLEESYHDSEDEDPVTLANGENGHVSRRRSSLRRFNGKTDSVFEENKPRGELAVVVLEELAIIGEVAIHLTALLAQAWGPEAQLAAAAGLATWTYVLGLTSMRLFLSASSRHSNIKYWNHTLFLYTAQWLFTVILFRSAIIHPRSTLAQILTVTDFILVTLLTITAFAARRGNMTVLLEHEPNLEPSREPIASLLSRLSFAWADPIIWKGYRKNLELSDVWDLASKDKASTIIQDYHQVKKTSQLAWHLIKYFRRLLLLQAAWSTLSSVFTFAPTLLLKAILEYIEEPESTPKNAAWLYVILLLATGLIMALGDGQSLWIGRRICIRLRAIIIGDIYAKALRRKVAAGTDTVLGTKAPNELKRTLLSRLSFGGKQQQENKKSSDPPSAKSAGDSQVNVGTIINLMAVDSFKVSEVSAYLHFLWASVPIQIVLSVTLLYRLLGYSSIAGIGVMVLLLPINILIARGFSKYQKKIMSATDARIHMTNEVLQNIRIIKFFAWEDRFGSLVNDKRSSELRFLRNRYILWAFAATIWHGAPLIIAFLSFFIYTVVEKKDLIPSVAFTALSLFSILRVPLDQLADMLAHVQESKVSVDRVEEFLNEEETEKYSQLQYHPQETDGKPVVGLRRATCTWAGRASPGVENNPAFTLHNVDISFSPGQLNVIAGPTGAGKTSLLMALLGEMTLLDGELFLPGGYIREDLRPDRETGLTESVAYCAQQAWLVNDTIKQNILFASPYDEKRYKEVLSACSLGQDLEALHAGDSTLVGEKGIALSGGQKQRISLARALYSNTRHILLDDCLSAVDSHTAKWIFEHCIMGPLMYNRTCILVTHNILLCVPHAQHVVVLDNGKVVAQGSPDHVIASGALGDEIQQSRSNSKPISRVPSQMLTGLGNEEVVSNGDAVNGTLNGPVGFKAPGLSENDNQPDSHVHAEVKAVGGVKWTVVKLFLSAMGSWFYWTVLFVLFTVHQLTSVATNVWIRQWANSYHDIRVESRLTVDSPLGFEHATEAIITHRTSCIGGLSCLWSLPFDRRASSANTASFRTLLSEVDISYYLTVYATLIIGYMLLSAVREGTVFYGSLAASRKIHRRLLKAVSRAKFSFFDSTPLGQIMNRFSKDIEAVDQEVTPVALSVIGCLASVIAIVVLISIITPGFLIAGVFITAIYVVIGRFYIRASRDLKRIESVQRSPLYQHFGETLSGVSTIRAYGDECRFIRENTRRVNTHNRPFLYLWSTNRWLALRVDVAGAFVSFFAGCFVVRSAQTIDPGAAGLSLIYAITFTENILWLVRLYGANEQNMNSVERIKEYMDVEQEAPAIIPDARPPANWPSQGAVQFVDYSTRYRSDLEPVLRRVSFSILPFEKVGIVGRTGAGKSSLALALFRGLEAEEGMIMIDDVNIGLIGLQDLRQSVTVVPQDPTLFTGTIRSNLDPFSLFTNEEIFTTLRRVRLIGPAEANAQPSSGSAPESSSAPANKNIFLDLSSPITESGNNLSQGQKQLLCLARAMLQEPRVIVMDEATASIDYSTDAKLQQTIRELKGTTITIAHRLQTIIDYDKVLVLEKGEVKEFDHPWTLLQRTDGIFRSMCETSGDLQALEDAAKKAWREKQLVDIEP